MIVTGSETKLNLSRFEDFQCILKFEYSPTVYVPTYERNLYNFQNYTYVYLGIKGHNMYILKYGPVNSYLTLVVTGSET